MTSNLKKIDGILIALLVVRVGSIRSTYILTLE
jgi:hypothetical protein